MEESTINEDGEKMSSDKISPKITRPKLPKFSSHTLGHHYRHKTDPGKAVEIKHLMEEIKKWKDGNVFDQSIRPTIIKPQTMLKAHSTQTSPRASPPPGSPNVGNRSSSLNRNRSRSLKLLTDKLKSPRGGPKDTSLSPNIKIPRVRKDSDEGLFKSTSAESSVNDAPVFPELYQSPEEESNFSREIISGSGDTDKDRTPAVESIPERDEEDEKCDKESTSSGDTAGTPEMAGPKIDSKLGMESPKFCEEEGAAMSDGDTPTTHVSTYTLHPIDRNSEFLRLRKTAPPKRRPGYAGLSLPKPKIPPMLKFQTDEAGDESGLKRMTNDERPKKPNKLDLSGLSGSIRKLSTPIFPTKSKDECKLDLAGYNIFRTPSTESPSSLPGDESRVPGENPELSPNGEDETKLEEQGAACLDVGEVVTESVESEIEKVDKRNGRSPKQKSKSDPSGNKSFDFNVSMINSSQSQSFPLLQKDTMDGSISEMIEDQCEDDHDTNVMVAEKDDDDDLDVLNNNENPLDQESVGHSEPIISYSGTEQSASGSEDVIVSPQSDFSETVDDDLMSRGMGDPMSQSIGYDGFQRMESGGMSPVQENEGDDYELDEGLNLASSVYSYGSESSTSTPISYSPTGTLERQTHLLSVPTPGIPLPKRPIARSVSSASVLQRERKHSANNKEKDISRKHSLTTGEDVVQGDNKSMEFLPIGDTGNIMASSMPSVWSTDRHPSISPEREAEYVKVRV